MIEKKYSKSFDEVLQQAYLFHDGYLVDEADFAAASPLFGLTFAADFLADIVAADALPTNADDLNDQTVYTQAVDDSMDSAREHYRKLLMYINLAWPEDKTIAKAFGSRIYEKARSNTLKLINLMQDAFNESDSATYKTDLIAVGFVQADIDLLNTLAEELTTNNRAQEKFMRLSFARSEERVVAFNKFWDTMVKISNTSKIVFKDSPAKIQYYMLYSTVHHSLGKPQNLTAVVDLLDPNSAGVDFDAVADATEYKIYRSEVAIGAPSGIYTESSSSATNHFDAPIIVGMRNYWKVRAFNDTESSTYSDEVYLDG